MSELVKNLRFWYERSDMGDINPELVKQAADLLEKQDRLIGLYRLRETLRVHPATEAAIRLREVNEEIAKQEETL